MGEVCRSTCPYRDTPETAEAADSAAHQEGDVWQRFRDTNDRAWLARLSARALLTSPVSLPSEGIMFKALFMMIVVSNDYAARLVQRFARRTA